MNLVKCPDCLHLCFSDSQECRSCSRGFKPGELGLKLESENKAFDRKCYAVFFILFLLVLIAAGYIVFQGPALTRTQHSLAISRVDSTSESGGPMNYATTHDPLSVFHNKAFQSLTTRQLLTICATVEPCAEVVV